MQKIQAAFLFTELLFLARLGFLEAKRNESGTFGLEGYTNWLQNHTIHLVNHVAEVGEKVLITSPFQPAPVDLRWFSLNMKGHLPHPGDKVVDLTTHRYLARFQKIYNISWHSVFEYDNINRWLKISNVRHDYADVFQVSVKEMRKSSAVHEINETFVVDITLMTFAKHECDFTSRPQNPKNGDVLILNCSVVVNGFWNATLVFRNDFDATVARGEISECGLQPSVGHRICSTVKVKAATTIFAYSCLLEFPSEGRHDPINPMFKHSRWTAAFDRKVVCNLPKIYVTSIPSDVTFLCNGKPCESTAVVNDTVTCVAHGFPEPKFDLHVRHLSSGHENTSQNQQFNRNTTNEKAETLRRVKTDIREVTIDNIKTSENYGLDQKDVGQVEVTCNTSNALGSGYKAHVLVVRSRRDDGLANFAVKKVKTAASARVGEFHPFGGITMLCNGRTCKNNEIMRFGDNVACHYDAHKVGGKMIFIMKIDGFEKNFTRPDVYIYTMRPADVGRHLVQCIGYIDSSISIMEINVVVTCAFRYLHGDPHHTEDYDDIEKNPSYTGVAALVILCDDAPCSKPGRTIYAGTYVTCRYTDQRVASLTFEFDGKVTFTQTPLNTTEGFLKLEAKEPKTFAIRCFDPDNPVVETSISLVVRPWPCPFDKEEEIANEDENYEGAAANQQKLGIVGTTESTTLADQAAPAAGNLEEEASGSGYEAAAAVDLEKSVFKSYDYVRNEWTDPRLKTAIKEQEHNIGSFCKESFVLLQLLLVFVGLIVRRLQF